MGSSYATYVENIKSLVSLLMQGLTNTLYVRIRSVCNSCKLEQRKAAIATYDNDVKLEKVLQARWLAAKSRAIDKSIPFTITKEDLLTVWKAQNGKCAISGLDMTYELGEGRIYTNVSIDQIMPSKGYTIDNIQLVCMAVNQLKSDLDMDTILILCSAIVDNAAKWKH